MPSTPGHAFLEELRTAWESGAFVKATFSGPVGAEPGLRNLRIRAVDLKAGRRLSVVKCFETRETVENFLPAEGILKLAEAFESFWSRAHLFTTGGDFEFQREADRVRVRRSRPAFTQAPPVAHDRVKPLREALSAAPFLQKLGVCNAKGEARPGMAGKLRQVQRFVEILGHLLEETAFETGRTLRVADMGAGKGYLTFALAHALRERGLTAEITGIEARAELVEASNRAAAELGLSSLRFEAGRIGEWIPPAGLDVLVALHACNTATDDALHLGVRAGASLLLASPCCHQEVRPQLALPPPLAPLAAHGILLERQAEIVTDALRAHLLELHGYSARVFEFVEPEHSGKNLMLSGAKRAAGGRPSEFVRGEIRAMWEAFGLKKQRLAELMGEIPK